MVILREAKKVERAERVGVVGEVDFDGWVGEVVGLRRGEGDNLEGGDDGVENLEPGGGHGGPVGEDVVHREKVTAPVVEVPLPLVGVVVTLGHPHVLHKTSKAI